MHISSSNHIIIRYAEKHDYPTVISLLNDLALYEGGICALDEKKLLSAISHDNPKLIILAAFVSKDNISPSQEMIGCLIGYQGFDVLSATHGSHISDVVVRHDKRGQKIGTHLMAHFAQETMLHGGEWLSWTVANNNKSAKNFYISHGAIEVGVDFMAMGITAMRALIQNILPQ